MSLRRSKFYREQERRIWITFTKRLASTKTIGGVERILQKVLSSHERELVNWRILVMLLLLGGRTYREISKLLWVSPSSISAIKKNFIDGNVYKSRYARELAGRKLKQVRRIKQEDLTNQEGFWKWLLEGEPAQMSGKRRWQFLNRL